jgi:hypothetical protein
MTHRRKLAPFALAAAIAVAPMACHGGGGTRPNETAPAKSGPTFVDALTDEQPAPRAHRRGRKEKGRGLMDLDSGRIGLSHRRQHRPRLAVRRRWEHVRASPGRIEVGRYHPGCELNAQRLMLGSQTLTA